MHHIQGGPHGLAHVGFWLAAALCAPAQGALADSAANAPAGSGYASVRAASAAGIDGQAIDEDVVGTSLVDASSRTAHSAGAIDAAARGRYAAQVQASDAAPGAAPLAPLAPAQVGLLRVEAASGASWACVDDGILDGARAGFTRSDGLMVSLGIDRLVSINGDVVAHSRIDIADLGRVSADQARQTSDALSSVKLVQNGAANIYRAADLGAALGGIVVQNSLNDQAIRTETVIESTVNSASLLNALHFQSTLQEALARAAGTR